MKKIRIEAIVDGGMIGSNPGKGGWGGRFEVINEDDNSVISRRFFGESFGDEEVTNNICEWRAVNGALIKYIEYYNESFPRIFKIISDSKLVVMQGNNEWQCKDDRLIRLKDIYKRLNGLIDTDIELVHMRREFTTCAHDHIAKILGRK